MTFVFWAIAGGVLNRFSGWTDYLPGRNIYYAALAALAAVWYFYGAVWGGFVFVSFLLYRIPGWYKSLDMGTFGGTLAGDAAVMFLRGLLFAPVFVWSAYMHQDAAPLLWLGLASGGAVLSYVIGNYYVVKIMRDPFWFIEFAAGACFGLAVGLAVTL